MIKEKGKVAGSWWIATSIKERDGMHHKKKEETKRKPRRGGRRVLYYSALRIIKTLGKIIKAKLARRTTAGPHTP